MGAGDFVYRFENNLKRWTKKFFEIIIFRIIQNRARRSNQFFDTLRKTTLFWRKTGKKMDEKKIKIPVYREEILVVPSDADEFAHANNTRYVHWMQQVATAHSAAFGWTAERYLALGAIWVARRHIIDYIHPIYPGETLLAETWVPEMKNVSSTRKYRFTRKSDGVLISNAETRWGFVDFKTGRPTRVPAELFELFTVLQNPEEG